MKSNFVKIALLTLVVASYVVAHQQIGNFGFTGDYGGYPQCWIKAITNATPTAWLEVQSNFNPTQKGSSGNYWHVLPNILGPNYKKACVWEDERAGLEFGCLPIYVAPNIYAPENFVEFSQLWIPYQWTAGRVYFTLYGADGLKQRYSIAHGDDNQLRVWKIGTGGETASVLKVDGTGGEYRITITKDQYSPEYNFTVQK